MLTPYDINEAAFIADGRAFLKGTRTVNPFVSNMTCYGVPYDRALVIKATLEREHYGSN